MAGEQDGNLTPNPKDGAGDGGGDKLIFGKYKTMEDAEKGHKEAERKLHEVTQKYSSLEERLDIIESSRNDEGYGRGRSQEEFRHEAPAADNTRILQEFYQDPIKVLSAVEERATLRAKQSLQQEAKQNSDHASRVNAWMADNQDVVVYPDLLTYWVNQTDARLSPEKRLDKAAAKVRARVVELKGKPAQGEPEPDAVIEGVDQSGAPASGKKVTKPNGEPKDPESVLASYAQGRNRQVRKPLGQPRQK